MDTEREEKLRLAKEKLKKFQSKRRPDTATPPPAQPDPSAPPPPPTSSVQDHFTLEPSNPAHPSSTSSSSALTEYFQNSSETSTPFPVNPGHDDVFSNLTQAPPSDPHVEPSEVDPQPVMPVMDVNSGLSLSEQISQVLNQTDPAVEVQAEKNDEIATRNRDLSQQVEQYATSLQQYETYCQSLNEQLQAAQQEVAQLQTEQAKVKVDETEKYQKELQAYKDSISMLVGEKSDFEGQIKKLENSMKMREVEVTSLKQMLLESEQRANESLERAQASDHGEKAQSQLANLEATIQNLNVQLNEKDEDVAYLKSRLGAKEQESSTQAQTVASLKSKLEMAELNLTQLRSVALDHPDEEAIKARQGQEEKMSRLEDEKDKLVKREAELTAYIQQASQDREQIIHQYTNYSQQLAAQIETITQKLNDKIQENAQMTHRETELTNHIGQLETQLQQMLQAHQEQEKKQQSEAGGKAHQASSLGLQEVEVLRKKVLSLDERLSEVIRERDDLQGRIQAQDVDIQSLKLDSIHKANAISDLETQNEMLKANDQSHIAHTDLVAACESDKVAASRAMAQNQQLKEQNEELQRALVEMTNAKAEIMDELDTVRRRLTSLMKDDKISELVSQVSELSTAVDERDRIIDGLKSKMQQYVAFAENSIHGRLDAGEDVFQGEQAQGSEGHESEEIVQTPEQVQESLLVKLNEAEAQIRSLDSHNSELKRKLELMTARNDDHRDESPSSMSDSSTSSSSSSSIGSSAILINNKTGGSSLSSCSSPVMLEGPNSHQQLEPPQLHEVTNEFSKKRSQTPSQNESDSKKKEGETMANSSTQTIQVSSSSSSPKNGVEKEPLPVISRDVALIKLEQKFKDAMNQIADLSAEKEQLEHVNVQLQEETETVGEYITIYQYQRQQIKRRMEEKEEQLQQVSREREEFKAKLGQLQSLVTHYLSDNQNKPQQNASTNPQNMSGSEAGLAVIAESSSHDGPDNTTINNNPPELAQEMTEHHNPAQMDDSSRSLANPSSPLPPSSSSSSSPSSPSAPASLERHNNEPSKDSKTASSGGHVINVEPKSMTTGPKSATAKKILDLLSEMENNQILDSNFHPYFFWDSSYNSRQLQTV
ncbi:hypothetical protein TCAL_00468 [Tigriopus californicus]|uniref:Golgin subfamily A conserved domain-containing protein n=1 Tax=Tigriopus californicus TaxID=6832 RepID=A0A553NB79_TIGCA|nr:golgin subfamily A member 2-like [Tigriopus californicus]TRY62639.1 hypothetical protein TCAL_00468 [Tigriopus californicus]|eukprot:TCALIF_00468-PA protein Name:"Similar to GOLGA2 Golgin subfamily A member 2 (Homo sapiens)" AED:0.03 eAED:0.03 QI:124/1/1/1/1/1/10/126/1110